MPGPQPRTNTCQKWNVLFWNGSSRMVCIGSVAVVESKSKTTTSVAHSEKIERLTPASEAVTPSGCGEPGSVENGRVIDSERGRDRCSSLRWQPGSVMIRSHDYVREEIQCRR